MFASGCAQKDWIDRTLVTVDVTGTWRATNITNGIVVQLELEQQGATVKGVMHLSRAAVKTLPEPGMVRLKVQWLATCSASGRRAGALKEN